MIASVGETMGVSFSADVSHLDSEKLNKLLDPDPSEIESLFVENRKTGEKCEFTKTVRCKDCRYRPMEAYKYGMTNCEGLLIFPTDDSGSIVCPIHLFKNCYKKVPDDMFFCARGDEKRREEDAE